MVDVVRSIGELRQRCDAWRGRGARVGLVPTMGALHEGHMSLVNGTRDAGATHIVLTVFVNPTQFAPTEDLSRYPRTFEEDLKRCEQAAVDLVFAPDTQTMYPAGYQTYVSVDAMTQSLEGTFRPTHFRGVTTVVAKLFNATGPCVAAFGRKDYQQWRVIETMARDLEMPVEVLGCPILREPDGLAMSSRNRYLSQTDRERALCLSRGLNSAREAFVAGERSAEKLTALVSKEVTQGCDRVDYAALVDADDLTPVIGQIERSVTLLVAAHLGTTRLIDNTTLNVPRARLGDGPA